MWAEIWFLNEYCFIIYLSILSTDLFMNPLTQEYNYRAYTIDNIKSLELLDRKSMYLYVKYVDFFIN